MISVSDEWKELHQEKILPESFVEIQLNVIDDGVEEIATVVASNEAEFSNSAEIVNKQKSSINRYALLEHNLWMLDGSQNVLSDVDSLTPPGFVSSEDTLGGLTITLSETRSKDIPGFTITWSNEYEEYATKFSIEVKLGDTVLASKEVTNNTAVVSNVEMTTGDYDSVNITIHEWSIPEHRARIDSVMFGQILIFDKNEILSYSHEQTGDPLGCEISKNSIEFSLNNSDGRWDILNPLGLGKYLYERQPLVVRYGMVTSKGVEWIQSNVFYLAEWRIPNNGLEAYFTARDAIDFLLYTNYSRSHHVANITQGYYGVYAFPTIDDAYVGDTSGTDDVYVGTTGTQVKISEYGAYYNNTYADPITGAVFYAYKTNKGWVGASTWKIELVNCRMADDINAGIKSLNNSLFSKVYITKNLELRYADYTVPEISIGEMIQGYANGVGATMWQKSDGTLMLSYPSKTLSDYVIPMAIAYSHPEIELGKPLRNVKVVKHYFYTTATAMATVKVADEGEDIIVDNPYMWDSTDNVWENFVANKYIEFWKARGWVSGEFRADPRLELFDVISVESKHGLISPVMITRIKYTYNGSFRGEYKGKILSEDWMTTTAEDGEV